jgi:hypothetical protein
LLGHREETEMLINFSIVTEVKKSQEEKLEVEEHKGHSTAKYLQ